MAASTRAPSLNGTSIQRGLEVTLRAAAQALVERFDRAPQWFAAAPGRVNLIGEHTDYNDGFVLPMAIDRYTVFAAAPAADSGAGPVLYLHSVAVGGLVAVPLRSQLRPSSPRWANYVRGVVSGFQRRGASLRSLCASVVSDVPLGGGLSSSAALEVSAATLLEATSGTVLDPVDKARLCQTAEHEFAGVPCGIMDPLASILGEERGPLLIDCRSGVGRVLSLADHGVSILIVNTNTRHSLGDGAYAKRRAECEAAATTLGVTSLRDATLPLVDGARELLGPLLYRRARHVVTENARTLEAARAFESGDSRAAGALFYESHRSLRDDYEVSCEELDVLVDTAKTLGEGSGVHGARMTGGGFGGCAVALVRTDRVDVVQRDLCRIYRERTGRTADAFVSRPAKGAHTVAPALLLDPTAAAVK